MAYFPIVVGGGFSCAIVFATKAQQHAVLGFGSIAGYKLTDVSDETIEGHPLTGKGLAAHRAFLVKNSPWIKELEAIDRVHWLAAVIGLSRRAVRPWRPHTIARERESCATEGLGVRS